MPETSAGARSGGLDPHFVPAFIPAFSKVSPSGEPAPTLVRACWPVLRQAWKECQEKLAAKVLGDIGDRVWNRPESHASQRFQCHQLSLCFLVTHIYFGDKFGDSAISVTVA